MLKIRRINSLPNATIYSLTETAPLIKRARPVRQSSFLGHVLRFPESEPFREFAMHVSTHGRRKSRRKRTLFTSYIHCLLGDPNSLLSDNQLLEMAAIDGGNLWSTALQQNGWVYTFLYMLMQHMTLPEIQPCMLNGHWCWVHDPLST